MSDHAALRLSRFDDVAVLEITGPGDRHLFTEPTLVELRAQLLDLHADPDLRALVLQGDGDESFIGGLDPTGLLNATPDEVVAASAAGQEIGRLLDEAPFVTIAAVNGAAIGCGCEFAMACDLTYASPAAMFVQIETAVGLTPSFSGNWRLTDRVGSMRAREMILGARPVDGRTAEAIGLVLACVPASELREHCLAVARLAATNEPRAVRLAKLALRGARQRSLAEHNILERHLWGAAATGPEVGRRVSAVLADELPASMGLPIGAVAHPDAAPPTPEAVTEASL